MMIYCETQKRDWNCNHTRHNKFKTCESVSSIEEDIKIGHPLSLLILNTGKIVCSCMNKREHVLVTILPDDQDGMVNFGTWVTTVHSKIYEVIKTEKKDLLRCNSITHHALLLPVHQENDFGSHCFYTVTEDWNERRMVGDSIQCLLPKCTECTY